MHQNALYFINGIYVHSKVLVHICLKDTIYLIYLQGLRKPMKEFHWLTHESSIFP